MAMTLQTGMPSNAPGLEAVPAEPISPYGLRNSCDICFSSKLRCSRDRPVCARCRKQGTSCIYSPTKRPGRRRKVLTTLPDSELTAASLSYASKDPNPGVASVGNRDEMRSEEGEASAASHEATVPSSTLLVPQYVADSVMGDEDFEHFLGDLLSAEPSGMLDIELSNVNPLLTHEEAWLTFEPMREDSNSSGHAADPGPSTQNVESSVSSEDSSWLPSSVQFSAECLSLKRWTSSSRSLLLVGDVSRQNMSDDQCLCHIAIANLQLHRKSASNIRPTASLEVSLHLQRLLDWTRSIQKGCQSCQDDELVIFVIAGIADQLVSIYRAVIEDDAKDLQGGARNGGINQLSATRLESQQALFHWTIVRFGTKIIQGPAKTAFLGRLIGLRLQQIGLLLEDLLERKDAENGKEVGQPLRLMVSESLERLNVTTGILSMLDEVK